MKVKVIDVNGLEAALDLDFINEQVCAAAREELANNYGDLARNSELACWNVRIGDGHIPDGQPGCPGNEDRFIVLYGYGESAFFKALEALENYMLGGQ